MKLLFLFTLASFGLMAQDKPDMQLGVMPQPPAGTSLAKPVAPQAVVPQSTARTSTAPANPAPPVEPISDAIKAKVAVAQRDYLIAKMGYDAAGQGYDAAGQTLAQTVKEARDACEKTGSDFSERAISCVERPKTVK